MYTDLRRSGSAGFIWLEKGRLRAIVADSSGRWTQLVFYCYKCREIFLCMRANWIEVCAEGLAEIIMEHLDEPQTLGP